MQSQHNEAKDSIDITGVLSLANGGTGATTAFRAAQNLGMLTSARADLPSGPLRIDRETGRIDRRYFEGVADYRVEVNGPKKVLPGSVNEYQITNFDSRIVYTVTAETGTVAINDDRVIYTAPTNIALAVGFVVNGENWPLSFN